MATKITMPQLSDTMDQGTILVWLKKEGDPIDRGDALAEVATDKADLEIESFEEGTLLKIHAKQGETVKVGEIIAHIGEAGEKVDDVPEARNTEAKPPQEEKAAEPKEEAPAVVLALPTQESKEPTPSTTSVETWSPPPEHAHLPLDDERVKISPLAKNLAERHGIDYRRLQGTGEGGRIVKKDIEQRIGQEVPVEQIQTSNSSKVVELAQVAPREKVTKPSVVSGQGRATQPLSRMRQAIASRMADSATTVPHFYVTAKIEVDELYKMRVSLKTLPQYEGITFNHLIIKAVALVLARDQRLNSAYDNGNLVQPQQINIGIVTALDGGLLIPVVKNVDQLPLADVVDEAKGLVQRARAGRPKSDDLRGGTFTISNIGRYQVEEFTAIVNPGQGAILAIGSIQQEPVVRDGALVPARVMRVTASVDHRIIDGVMVGEFLTELKRLIEDPVLLLA